MQDLWAFMADKMLEAVNLEPDSDIVNIMMDSLCKVGKYAVSLVLFGYERYVMGDKEREREKGKVE